MSWAREKDTNRILALGKMASGMLVVLGTYKENGRQLSLKEKDINSLNDSITFLDYAIAGCESKNDLKKLFMYNDYFPATPASAFKLTLEILLERTQIPQNIDEIKTRCYNYKNIINKFLKAETVSKEDPILEETITFFDGIDKKADAEIYQNAYSIKLTSGFSRFLNPA